MKKWLLALLALAIVLFVYLKPGSPTPKNSSPQAALSNALTTVTPQVKVAIEKSFSRVSVATNTTIPAAVAPAVKTIAGPAHPVEITNMAPFTVLENARTAIRNYGQRFGGNPVGSNLEITRSLMGDNPKQLNFISADSGLRVNSLGEMIDAWGTPLFFHQISGVETEIHSAGPDKIMWTLDDLVAR